MGQKGFWDEQERREKLNQKGSPEYLVISRVYT